MKELDVNLMSKTLSKSSKSSKSKDSRPNSKDSLSSKRSKNSLDVKLNFSRSKKDQSYLNIQGANSSQGTRHFDEDGNLYREYEQVAELNQTAKDKICDSLNFPI